MTWSLETSPLKLMNKFAVQILPFIGDYQQVNLCFNKTYFTHGIFFKFSLSLNSLEILVFEILPLFLKMIIIKS